MFQPICEQFKNLLIANFYSSPRKRIIIIRHSAARVDDDWTIVPRTNIILVGGSKTESELKQFLAAIPSARYEVPGQLSGSTDNRLRHYLGLLRSN